MTVSGKSADGRARRRARAISRAISNAFLTLFPRLQQRLAQRGGTLSGGEQQMLAIARALMSRPRLLMLDEPSLGLAPLIVKQIFDAIRTLNRQDGPTVFLVEQNAYHALKLAHRGYVMVNGAITLSGTGRELLATAGSASPPISKADGSRSSHDASLFRRYSRGRLFGVFLLRHGHSRRRRRGACRPRHRPDLAAVVADRRSIC